VGDEVVMVNAGIAQARATGFLERHVIDPRYGKTVDDWLIDRRVIQGLEEHGPYTCSAGQACLFDPDDLDNGTDGRDAPSDEPLRVTIDTGDGGKIAFRMPYVEPTGSHSVGEPDPAAPFDWATFVINQVIYYLHTRGDPDPALLDDPCLATNDCPFLVE